MALTKEYLDALKQLLASTTPGPWTSFVEGRDHDSGSSFIRTGGDDIELAGASAADQDFIARARQDIPPLVAQIERLEALVKAARTAAE